MIRIKQMPDKYEQFNKWSTEALRIYAQSRDRPLRASLNRDQLVGYVQQMTVYTHTFMVVQKFSIKELTQQYPDMVVTIRSEESITLTTRISKAHLLKLGMFSDTPQYTHRLAFDPKYDIHSALSNPYFKDNTFIVSMDKDHITISTHLNKQTFLDMGIFSDLESDKGDEVVEGVESVKGDEGDDGQAIG